MKSKILVFLLVLSFMLVGAASSAFADLVDTYLPGVSWSSGWSDAEKKSASIDSEMCWAAASSNVLDYTGWGAVGGFSDEDAIFSDFATHWTNLGGDPQMAYAWWFTGVEIAYGKSGYSQIETSQKYYPPTLTWNGYIGMDIDDYLIGDYYRGAEATTLGGTYALTDLDDFVFDQIDDGYGTTISVSQLDGGSGHAMTAWGYGYDADEVSGIQTGFCLYLSHSDDNEYGGPDDIDRYWLTEGYSSTVGEEIIRLYLEDEDGIDSSFYGYLDAGRALARYDDSGGGEVPVPEPATLLLLGSGLAGLFGIGRRKFKRS